MVQIFSEWVCEDCQTRNQTYYTSKNLPRSLFNFLCFPTKLKNDVNIIHAHTVTPNHGDVPNWNTIITIPYAIESIQDINIDIICDKMTPMMGWGWSYGEICPKDCHTQTHLKVDFYPIHGSSAFLANDAKFTITLKFKLKA